MTVVDTLNNNNKYVLNSSSAAAAKFTSTYAKRSVTLTIVLEKKTTNGGHVKIGYLNNSF